MWVEQHSRWLGRLNGNLIVWKVLFYHQIGRLDTWRITQYDVECEETGEDKEVPFDAFQQRIAKKQLIPIGDHTKEQWIEKSKL
jgi:hypothetical protein